MSMISCNRNCANQQEGYCCLEQITSLPACAAEEAGCLYYIAREDGHTGPDATAR